MGDATGDLVEHKSSINNIKSLIIKTYNEANIVVVYDGRIDCIVKIL